MTNFPVLTVSTAAQLRGLTPKEFLNTMDNKNWFYSHTHNRFLLHVQEENITVSMNHAPAFHINAEEVTFTIEPYSLITEIGREGGYPSSVLLAKNFMDIVQEHLDVEQTLEYVILTDQSKPILLGESTAVKRLLTGVPTTAYHHDSVVSFVKGRGDYVQD